MQIRKYLGWSERFHQTDSRLEQAMNALDGSQSDDARTDVLATLTKVADIDTRLTGALDSLGALQVGSIKLPGALEIGMLRSEGRRLIGGIAALMGVEVRHDYFSPSGPTTHAGAGGMSGGNMPPLG